MIRFLDSATLAYTKLRTHKVRTGITIGIAGILFGLLLAIIFITQGIFDSIGRFSEVGLNNRAIITLSYYEEPYRVYDNLENEDFIAIVEAHHKKIVATKSAAAKKHGVSYVAELSDPSPIEIDAKTKQKRISEEGMSSKAVVQAAEEMTAKTSEPFDINTYLLSYPSAKILSGNAQATTGDEQLAYMKDGKDPGVLNQQQRFQSQMGGSTDNPSLTIMNQSVTDPFISGAASFDPTKGEVPAIIPFKSAEKLLGLEKLSGKASLQEKYDRLNEVRSRISEVTADFCYRNMASQQLLAKAIAQQDAREDAKGSLGSQPFIAPAVEYAVPADDSCGAIITTKDNRTTAEKKLDEAYINYEKEIGTYIGEPEQYKVTVRPVGISGDIPEGSATFDVGGLVQGLLGSWLSYGDQWVIPATMAQSIPDAQRPAFIDTALSPENTHKTAGFFANQYMIEFEHFSEARDILKRSGMFGGQVASDRIFLSPFGSSTLLVAEMKDMLTTVIAWALLVIGGIAIIIMGSIIGRTVSEGRRESAIFRAIGARRIDIGSIYGMYSLLLSIRVAIFALVLGVVVAVVAEILNTAQATLAARYAYAAVDADASFHFFGVANWYVLVIIAAIIVAGLIASIIPVVRSARRNPIKDMRDDT